MPSLTAQRARHPPPPPPRGPASARPPQHVRNLGIDNETPAMYPHVVTNAKRRMAQRGEQLSARAFRPSPRPDGPLPRAASGMCETTTLREPPKLRARGDGQPKGSGVGESVFASAPHPAAS